MSLTEQDVRRIVRDELANPAKEPEPVVTWHVLWGNGVLSLCVGENDAIRSFTLQPALKAILKLTRYPGQKRAEAEVVEERS